MSIDIKISRYPAESVIVSIGGQGEEGLRAEELLPHINYLFIGKYLEI